MSGHAGAAAPSARPDEVVAVARLEPSNPDCRIYLLGPLDRGVTVLAQQTRALNLAWSLVEEGLVDCAPRGRSTEVAVVGGGFAGLTVAAALLRKSPTVRVSVFERRDNVLALQQGSDSRWLHPQIYEWPRQGSEAPSASLPILNWIAARASDVVVQVLREWETLVGGVGGDRLRVRCNARHLRLAASCDRPRLEWIAEDRVPAKPSHLSPQTGRAGAVAGFDHVILALGFGLEASGATSYWRNETLGQPQLEGSPRTYVVSGAGDGAAVDVLRLRVAEFRQDRILRELFHAQSALKERLRQQQRTFAADPTGTFEALEAIRATPVLGADFEGVLDELRRRLRRDTRVVLHVKPDKRTFAQVLAAGRLSFQNALLLYMLYNCGGFEISTSSIPQIKASMGSSVELLTRRGPDKTAPYDSVLDEAHMAALAARMLAAEDGRQVQTSEPCWPGGYFDYEGTLAAARSASDTTREAWRKEYLPVPTQLLASSFCADVAGRLAPLQTGRLRVALHRLLPLRGELLLQQACGYEGVDLRGDEGRVTAGRTFLAREGTIGLAYQQARVVATRAGASAKQLREDMQRLQLHVTTREMAKSVRFVMAVPLLGRAGVVGALYLDSEDDDFTLEPPVLAELLGSVQRFLERLSSLDRDPPGRMSNFEFPPAAVLEPPAGPPPQLQALELLDVVPPSSPALTGINFEFDDFVGGST